MKLSELQEQIKTDLRIDPDDLAIESARTPDIHWSYSKMLMTEKLALKKLQADMKELNFAKWEYFTKKADPEVYKDKPLLKKIMSTDVKQYICVDREVLDLQARIDGKEELIDYIARTLDQVSGRQWIIKNIIEHRKFLAGGLVG